MPAVDFADVKAMWAVMQDIKRRHPEGNVATGMGVFQKICSPGANIGAISYRLGKLGLVEHLLEAAYPGGEWSEAALKAISTMELTWMPIGVPQKGLSFDLVALFAQARAEAA